MATGGTGGHVFPSLAIADEITRRDASNRVLFIGNGGGVGGGIVPAAGYPLRSVHCAGVSGGGVFRTLSGLLLTTAGTAQAVAALREFRPDVVVGTGGYASVPASASAIVMGIPLVVCEPNSVSGLANAVLARFAKKMFVSFAHSSGPGGGTEKVRIVGNPVRKTLVSEAVRLGSPQSFPCSGVRTVFVIGGSQGAMSLNRVIPHAIAEYRMREGVDVRVIHQTGKGGDGVAGVYRRAGIDARVFDFSPDIADFYSSADMVVSRSGAGAVAEIALFAKPSILIPYPHSTHSHQRSNAEMMQKAGASVLMEEEGLSKEAVAKALQKLLNWDTLVAMSLAAAALAAPDAAKRIVDEIEELVWGGFGARKG